MLLRFWEIEFWVAGVQKIEKGYCWHWRRLGSKDSFVQVSWEMGFWVYTIIFLGRWSWKGHSSVTLEKNLDHHFFRSAGRQRCSSQYDSFTQKVVIKRPPSVTLTKMVMKLVVVCDTGEATALHTHCTFCQERSPSWYHSFIQKMILRM